MIVANTAGMEDIVVRGITLKRDLARVILMGVPNKPGVASRIFAKIAQHQVVVDDIIQNIVENATEANIGFTTTKGDAKEAQVIGEDLIKELGIRRVEMEQNLAKVSIVGVGMKTHTGVAARMFSAMANAKINIQNITTSEIVISCIVDEKDGEKAVQVLHSAFGLDKNSD